MKKYWITFWSTGRFPLPSSQVIIQADLDEAKRDFLEAEWCLEHYRGTTEILRERIKRLQKHVDSGKVAAK